MSGALMVIETIETVEISNAVDESPAVSWAAVAAGAIAAAALTFVLLAFGAGMGFSSVSPWGNSGVSASTFQISTGLYLIVVAMLASTIGGFLAGRITARPKGRSANRTASSWSAKWCCGALRSRHREGMSASAIAISSIRRHAGSSAVCGWPSLFESARSRKVGTGFLKDHAL